jgi:hypothetical protein
VAWATASELKTYLGISGSGDDSLLTTLLAQAQAFLEQVIGRKFEASTNTTRTFDAVRDVVDDQGWGWGALLVLDHDLCSINSVTNGDSTVVSSSDYVTEPRNDTPYWGIRLKRSATAAWTYSDTPENAISISGKWAYSATCPDDVKRAVLDLAAYHYRRRGVEGTALDRPTVSPSGVTMFPGGLPESVKAVIGKYQVRGGR